MRYKALVQQIRAYPWSQLDANDLLQLMVLATWSAREFADSLRIALELYPENRGLQIMAEGELNTTNLVHGSYQRAGDHANFLEHFGVIHEVVVDEGILHSAQRYAEAVEALPPEVRAMSIFSREQELPGIFREILTASGWDGHPALQAFRYYLERHIELDSGDEGHAELLAEMLVDDRVEAFYQARVRMYEYLFREFALP